MLISGEDIGSHNAVDRVPGECIPEDIPTENRMVLTSGRISSEMLLKVAMRDIPMSVSISAPTNLAVRLASDLDITLIAFARGKGMNVHAHGWGVGDRMKVPAQETLREVHSRMPITKLPAVDGNEGYHTRLDTS